MIVAYHLQFNKYQVLWTFQVIPQPWQNLGSKKYPKLAKDVFLFSNSLKNYSLEEYQQSKNSSIIKFPKYLLELN